MADENPARYYTPLVIFSVTLALLVQEIMLSAVLHVVVGAYGTLVAISVASDRSPRPTRT